MSDVETYDNWIQRVVRDPAAAKPLASGEVVKTPAGEPFGAVEFVKITTPHFLAEIGKKGNKYIYHIYPAEQHLGHIAHFYNLITDAFVFIFKNSEQIEGEWVEEMKSWAIRVSGWTDNVWGDELALRVITLADEKLRAQE